MQFKTATEVADVIRAGTETRITRSANRALIDNAINGFPFLSDEETKAMGNSINCNWGEMVNLHATACGQYEQAFLGPENFFKVTIFDAPPEQKMTLGSFITEFINRKMKRNDDYNSLKTYQFGAVVAHGIGPQIWCDKEEWCPEFVAVDDLLIATDTRTDFKNLEWFGVRTPYTEGELTEKVFGENSDKGWKKGQISKILNLYHDQNYKLTDGDWITSPEKMADLVKQSGNYFMSDAVPTIPLISFYYRVREKGKKPYWKLVVVPDVENNCRVMGTDKDEFLYDSGTKPVADDVTELLFVQYGDLNSKAPFKYHSVRSLDFLLFDACYWLNIIRDREVDHVMDALNVWFRIQSPNGEARAQMINLGNKKALPDGVSIVPNTERHQIDPRLLESVTAQLRQLQNDSSAAYSQKLDTGTKTEQTAFEVHTKLSQVNGLLARILSRAFRQEVFNYREICRRFCLKGTSNEDAKEFQAACKKKGIPAQFLDSKNWDIQPEIPMGSGNKTMAMAQAQQLMQIRNLVTDPDKQKFIVHEFIEAILGDAKMASYIEPLETPNIVRPAALLASNDFSVMMNAIPPLPHPSANLIDQIETLLGMVAGVISKIDMKTNLQGIATVLQQIQGLIQRFAQDQSQSERIKKYSQALGQLGNQFKQAATEIQKREQEMQDPEGMANAQAKQAESQAKIQTMVQSSQVKAQISQGKFQADQHRKDVKLSSDLKHKDVKLSQDMRHQDIELSHDLTMENVAVGHELNLEKAKTASEIQNQKELTNAKASAAKNGAEKTETE